MIQPPHRTEVPLKDGKRLDAASRRKATEVERSGDPAKLRQAATRLKQSGRPQKVLQVPQKDLSKAGNVTEWVETIRPPGGELTFMTKGGSFINSEPYYFLCAAREAQPSENGRFVGYIGFRCAMDAQRRGAQTEELVLPSTSKQVKGKKLSLSEITPIRKDPPEPLLNPLGTRPALYRSRAIQIFPVAALFPWDRTNPAVTMVYLPYTNRNENALENPISKFLKFEIRVPYLPGDRFGILFEHSWSDEDLRPGFSEDFTSAALQSSWPGGNPEISVTITGGLDYVDIDYEVKNVGKHEIEWADHLCLQQLQAPNFRDHDGTRTFLMTDQGFQPIIELWHHVDDPVWMLKQKCTERLWMQLYEIGEKAPKAVSSPRIAGPLIATVSRDRQWVVSPTNLSGSPTMLINNQEYSCLHAKQKVKLRADQQKAMKQRVYFLKGGLADLASRYERDLRSE